LRWPTLLKFKASLVVIILVTTIFMIPAQTKAEEKEKITITIWGVERQKTFQQDLPRKDVERINELLEAIKIDPYNMEKIQELENFLKEKGLLPEDFSLKREKEKMEKEFQNMTWGEFKEKVIKRYPLFIPLLVMIFRKIETSTGIKEEGKLANIEKKSQQYTEIICNIACSVFAVGYGIIFPSFPAILLGIVPPLPVVIGSLFGDSAMREEAMIHTSSLFGDLSIIDIGPILFTILIFIGVGFSGLGLSFLVGVGGLVVASVWW